MTANRSVSWLALLVVPFLCASAPAQAGGGAKAPGKEEAKDKDKPKDPGKDGKGAPKEAGSAYERALARYREVLQRKPFRYHTEGREFLAETKRPEALQVLIADYTGAKDYVEHARYTLATLFGRHFDREDFLAPLAELRKSCSKPVDTWLWVNTLRNEAKRGDAEGVVKVALDGKHALHRAAAILALGQARKLYELSQAFVAASAEFPSKESERNLLLGAMSGALYENKGKVNDPDYRKALTAYIDLLTPSVKLSEGSKLQVARHLQWILNGPAMFVDPESWHEILARGEVKKPGPGATVTKPRFFGIESEGERICYVIDLSDSMCKLISPETKPKAPQGPITGAGAPKKKPKKAILDESDLPWDKIKNRFDLVREQLRISLSRLTKDKHFAVVWFGDESDTLDATKGMVPATKANVDRVMAELDAIETGPPDAQKAPDGVLRGKTNMHSGLRRAFGLSGSGYVEEGAYVDSAVLTEGCDTIFLLSDGAPSWDDFYVQDKDYGEGEAIIDAEYGVKAKRTPIMGYWGPYNVPKWLVDDVARMNAFRRARIHCIGIGEASMDLLRQLAEMGHGEVFAIGTPKQERKTPGAK